LPFEISYCGAKKHKQHYRKNFSEKGSAGFDRNVPRPA